MPKHLTVAKCVTLVAFLVTLSTTYYLRSEVLALSRIRYSAENLKAEEQVKVLKESYPLRLEEYEIAQKQYDLQMEHYEEMLKLYRTDYDAYVARLKDEYRPPQLPNKPHKPLAPEQSDQYAQINAEFRQQQYHYYDTTSRMNWICGAAALTLVGGLLWLIMFDEGTNRIQYLAVLVLSFVFMIGPSFHSILSAIVGFLQAPSVY